MFAEPSASLFPSGIMFAEPSASLLQGCITFAEPSASLLQSCIAFAEPSASLLQSGITFAEPSANISFFVFWLAHHVFIDVLKCALHASDCHALYPIYTIDADDFIRL